MIAKLALAGSLALLAFVLGMAAAPGAPPATPVRPGLRVAELRLEPAGLRAAQALAAADPGPAPVVAAAAAPASGPPRAAPPAPPPPPPPPPPVEDQLRRATAAVALEGGRLGLVLAGGGRRLHEGDSFMGWRLASVSRSGAVLSRGRERRQVALFGAPPAAVGTAGVLAPATLPPPPPGAPAPRPPTAEEFFRGFRG